MRMEPYCEEGLVVFQMADTDPGIPVSEEERLFEAFYRVMEHRLKWQRPGTGHCT